MAYLLENGWGILLLMMLVGVLWGWRIQHARFVNRAENEAAAQRAWNRKLKAEIAAHKTSS